jgi:hypothetical protein
METRASRKGVYSAPGRLSSQVGGRMKFLFVTIGCHKDEPSGSVGGSGKFQVSDFLEKQVSVVEQT